MGPTVTEMESRSIFGSGVERETYFALRKKWAKEVDVFPLLPVKVVVGFDRVQAIQDELEKDFLLKTEFDYVVCWKNRGIPVLVLEFDGIGGGFSRGVRYETRVVPINDPNRRRKLEAKLRICAEAKIPAVVVAIQEGRPIDAATHLTILDAIIGEALADGIFRNALKHQQFSSLDEVEDLEIGLSIRKNPIKRGISKLLSALIAAGLGTGVPRSQRPINDRENEDMIGCYTSVSVDGQEFSATVYVRDVNCQGFAAYGLAEDLSWLTALRDAAQASNLTLHDE